MKGELRKYWPEAGVLTVENGLLLRGSELVIPEILRKEILEKLHSGHEGIRQRPVDLYGGGHLFRSSEIIFFGKNRAKLFIFVSTAAKLFFCEVSHALYFLDDSLFKCKSITPLLNWFSTISTYAAKLFFY